MGYVSSEELFRAIKDLEKMFDSKFQQDAEESIRTISLTRASRLSGMTEDKIRHAIKSGMLEAIPDGTTPIRKHKNDKSRVVGGQVKYRVRVVAFREWLRKLAGKKVVKNTTPKVYTEKRVQYGKSGKELLEEAKQKIKENQQN